MPGSEDDFERLKIANSTLESDLISQKSFFENHKNGHFLWACTYRDLRSDDITGLIECYYRQKKLASHFKIRDLFAPLRIIVQYLKGLFFKTSSDEDTGFWISTGENEKKHRYKHLLEVFKSRGELHCFSSSLSMNVMVEELSVINFYEYTKAADIIKAFKTAISLRNYATKINGTTPLANWIRKTPWTFYFNTALKELWIERALMVKKPKCIFFATANTYPPARLMSRLAKLHNIPFVVVACRPMFVDTRPEERACKLDLDEVNNARIADYWIVWDKFSKTTLLHQGVSKDKIFISQEMKRSIIFESQSKNYLLLLTHDKNQNERLIDLWTKLNIAHNLSFAIRKHPICDLTNTQKYRLDVFEYDDMSNIPMDKINLKDTIAVTINSTAAIEVCSLGGGVIWLPFLNDKSIIFEPIFNLIGLRVNSFDELESVVEKNKSKKFRSTFIQGCVKSYHDNFKSEDQTNLFLSKITMN